MKILSINFSRLVSLLLLFLEAIILIACMSTIPLPESKKVATITSATSVGTNSNWTVELYLTGGFAGERKRIRVSSGSETVVIDEKINKRIELDLPEADLERIFEFVKDIEDLPQLPEKNSCIDCFHYEVEVSVGGSNYYTSFDDETLAQSEIKPLVIGLVNLMNNILDR